MDTFQIKFYTSKQGTESCTSRLPVMTSDNSIVSFDHGRNSVTLYKRVDVTFIKVSAAIRFFRKITKDISFVSINNYIALNLPCISAVNQVTFSQVFYIRK